MRLQKTVRIAMPEGVVRIDNAHPFLYTPFRAVDRRNLVHRRKAQEYFRKWVVDGNAKEGLAGMGFQFGEVAGVVLAVMPPCTQPEVIRRYLARLKGMDVSCWCGLCKEHRQGKAVGVACESCAPCHGDVLLEMANAGNE